MEFASLPSQSRTNESLTRENSSKNERGSEREKNLITRNYDQMNETENQNVREMASRKLASY